MKSETKFLICLMVCLWLPLYMGAFDKDKPAASTSLRSSNPEILANWSQIQSALNQDHEFAGTSAGTQSGKHEVVVFQEEASAGASATNEGHLQVIDGGTQPELAFTSEDGTELQFTKDGNLYSSNNLVVDGTSTFTGATASDLTLGAGFNLVGSSTSDILINTDKFTVDGATGNTLNGGTLDVVGNIDPTTYETTRGGFLDEDDMSSDAADKVASQQSIKAYVTSQRSNTNARAAAWVNFDGSDGIINGSYNVSSVNRTDTGIYTVTWTNVFSSTGYVPVVASDAPQTVVENILVGSIRIRTEADGGGQQDGDKVCVVVFGAT